ncbi:MAG: hypothetical protein WBE34_06795 [Candidatus Nitrosopolaris sp.]
MNGVIRLQDLVVSKFLGQDLDKQRSLFPLLQFFNRSGKGSNATVWTTDLDSEIVNLDETIRDILVNPNGTGLTFYFIPYLLLE